MKTAAECRKAAATCRVMLMGEPNKEHRRMLWVMIEIWEMLARERECPSANDLSNSQSASSAEPGIRPSL